MEHDTTTSWDHSQEYMGIIMNTAAFDDGSDDHVEQQQPEPQQQLQGSNVPNTNEAAAAAFVLESLLHELTFWEATPKDFLRKSKSVNAIDILMSNDNKIGRELRQSGSQSFGLSEHHQHQQQQQQPAYCHRSQQEQKQRQQQQQSETRAAAEQPLSRSSLSSEQQQHTNETSTASIIIISSPTLHELQTACHWQKAVDPATGRTYYYDVISRQTQWDKPREIRAIEKKIKKDQRKRDEAFFRVMEANLLASLSRGECIPLHMSVEKEGPPLELTPSSEQTGRSSSGNSSSNSRSSSKGGGGNGGSHNNSSRVRTISGMNEHLLAQLQQQPLPSTTSSSRVVAVGVAAAPPATTSQTTSLSTSPRAEKGRPPLPRPPPATTAAASLSMSSLVNGNGMHHATATNAGGSSSCNNSSSVEVPQQKQTFQSMNGGDDLELSPEEDRNKRSGDDSLRGERLLDSILADLEVSDDDSDTDPVQQEPVPVAGAAAAAKPKDTGVRNPATTNSKGRKADKNGMAPLSHIRRNTAGSVHTKGTMEKPDIDGTIHVVCGVIRAHIEQSLNHRSVGQSPNIVHVNLDIFRDDYECGEPPRARQRGNNKNNVPSLEEIKGFYREFYQRSQMEFDAIIMSLIYVERLIKETNGALMPSPDNWGSVVFSCMVLASKVWDDLSMWNIDFSNVSVNSGLLASFSLKRINQLELAVLSCLNFAVTIPGSEYAKYYYLLRNMMIRGGLLDPFAANQPLSNDEKNRLEDRTHHYQDSKINNDENPRRRVRSVDWSVLSGGSNSTASVGTLPSVVVAAGQANRRPEIVSGPVLRENVCLEQLLPMGTTRS